MKGVRQICLDEFSEARSVKAESFYTVRLFLVIKLIVKRQKKLNQDSSLLKLY